MCKGVNATDNNFNTYSNNIQNYLYKSIYPNKTLYQTTFNDITRGKNNGSIAGNKIGLVNYNTGIGFDNATGLGSPNCLNLLNELLKI